MAFLPTDSMRSSFCMCDALLVPPGSPHEDRVLIKNLSGIFDGENMDLITGKNVVIKGNKIEGLVPDTCNEDGYIKVIDGNGGYLTPGLIDCHWHTMLNIPVSDLFTKPEIYVAAVAVKESERLIMRGITTIRDPAGKSYGIKQAIDDGTILGPRIYPSGAMLAQYCGHGDFRSIHRPAREWGGPQDIGEIIGATTLCNGVDQVLQATRHNLYLGATQIKMAVSGGIASFGDPLYVNEFFQEEVEAAVRAATDYGTYLMVHCHNSSGARRALKAGVKSFDHIMMCDEETVKMLAEAGAWVSVQLLVAKQIAENYPKGDTRQVKAALALGNAVNVLNWAKKYNLNMGWGTDLLDSKELRDQQLEDLVMRTEYGFTPAELLVQATGNNGKMMQLTGKRNPYGLLGVIKPGAMADLLIYNKNPLEDIKVIGDYNNTLRLVMKDGVEVKNKLMD